MGSPYHTHHLSCCIWQMGLQESPTLQKSVYQNSCFNETSKDVQLILTTVIFPTEISKIKAPPPKLCFIFCYYRLKIPLSKWTSTSGLTFKSMCLFNFWFGNSFKLKEKASGTEAGPTTPKYLWPRNRLTYC